MFQTTVPARLASDSFDRANGAIGSTDGAGFAGEDKSDADLAWTNRVGTFAIDTNHAKASATAGGIAIATVTPTSKHLFLSAKLYRSTGEIGLIARYTDSSNYILAYYNGTNVLVDKVVGGVTTNLVNVAIAYSAGAELRLLVAMDSITAWYNNTWLAIHETATDAAIRTGTMCGIYADNTTDYLDNFFCFGSGHDNEYRAMRARVQRTPRIDVFYVGDSKTSLYYTYVAQMRTFSTDVHEYPRRSAISGGTMQQSAANIDAALAEYTDANPTYSLLNIGANDVAAMPAEGDWKTWCNYVLAAIHTKWPSCQVYLMRVWNRGLDANCNTLATWINDVVSLLDYAHEGPDERVFLENGDNGVTYTSDGCHPNEAGSALTAQQWRTLLGIA